MTRPSRARGWPAWSAARAIPDTSPEFKRLRDVWEPYARGRRPCDICGKPIPGERSDARTCSARCRKRASRLAKLPPGELARVDIREIAYAEDGRLRVDGFMVGRAQFRSPDRALGDDDEGSTQ